MLKGERKKNEKRVHDKCKNSAKWVSTKQVQKQKLKVHKKNEHIQN